MVNTLTTENFNETIENASNPVLVDFYADWCGPCRMMSPIIDELATEMGDRADFFKINVDEAENIAISLGIDSIPTIIIFKGGKEAARSIGLVSKEALAEKIGALL